MAKEAADEAKKVEEQRQAKEATDEAGAAEQLANLSAEMTARAPAPAPLPAPAPATTTTTAPAPAPAPALAPKHNLMVPGPEVAIVDLTVDDLKDEEIKIDNALGRMVSRLSDPKVMKKMSPVQDIGSSKTRIKFSKPSDEWKDTKTWEFIQIYQPQRNFSRRPVQKTHHRTNIPRF